MSTEEEINPYELLGVAIEATEQEIKTAYRQKSLKVHPDRNRGNPDAARKFHELNQAHELLLDPLRRYALDAKLKIKQARQQRFASYDKKRKDLVDELEERERTLKKARVEAETEKKERWHENERIMEDGRKLREEREKEMQRKAAERVELDRKAQRAGDGPEPPTLGLLDTTVRVKYTLAAHPSLTDVQSLVPILSSFGTLDEASIVLSLKPSPPKKPKRVIALVPYKQIGGSFAAVCASGRKESGLDGVEVDWAEGKEPELIGWLKKMGQLGGPVNGTADKTTASNGTHEPTIPSPPSANMKAASNGVASTADGEVSTFPTTFPDLNAAPPPPIAPTSVAGLDYESLTLMRMRQAERDRLEREIREREAAED